MSAPPDVSVIMANYNCARYVGAAITSLQEQSLANWELVLVDDASNDASVDIAASMAMADPRIKVVRQGTNAGPAAARNRALDLAQGRWISIFDSDDIMRPGRLHTLLVRALRDHADIVADNMLVFSDGSPAQKPFLPRHILSSPQWIDLARFVDSNRLYSRTPDLGYLKPFISADFLKRSGVRYDERLRIGEDYEFMARLLASGARFRLEPSALYLYRKHAASISHRLRVDAIEALIEADARLAQHVGPSSAEITGAFRRRGRSLKSMLLYDRVIALVKAGRYREAMGISMRAPRIWPLLTRPIRARFVRLASGRSA